MTTANNRDIGLSPAVPVLATVACIGLNMAGQIAFTSATSAALSVVILLCGLPHGSFDLALLRRPDTAVLRGWSQAALICLYLVCALGMYLLWRLAPVPALALFLLLAIVHFAEDWRGSGSAGGAAIATAIVSAPAWLHWESLGDLFALLTGSRQADMLANLLQAIAPVAVVAAAAAILLLWRAGRQTQAVSAACGLVAMLLLPPLLGFALFFCLIHSPMQFRAHAREMGLQGFGQWRGIVVPISLGGLGVAFAIYLLGDGRDLPAGLFASSFLALSVLTVPHMLVPLIVRPGER